MNRFIPLLLIFVLLTGCAAQNPVPAPAEAPPADMPVQAEAFMELAEESPAAAKYTLSKDVLGFLPLGNQLLFFCGEDITTLMLLDPVSRQTIAAYETGIALTAENATVQLLNSGLSYFNGHAGETVVLDNTLQEVRRIAAPMELTGMPLLSSDGNILYFCTPSAIRALDTTTGISRILREASYPVQGLSGLLLEDSVLQVSITEADGSWHTLFLSSETGQLLGDFEGNVLPETIGRNYYLCQQEGGLNRILFGTAGEEPMVLKPGNAVEDCFFLGNQVLATSWQSGGMVLDLYTLDTGLRTAFFDTLMPGETLRNAAVCNGCIWLLCDQQDGPRLLYRWDPETSKTRDSTIYTTPRYTRQEPDLDALAACKVYAQDMSSRHGLDILVYTDAAALEPWDYELEYEHDAAVLQKELELLDARLSNYPVGFLQTLAEKFTGIKISIVRSVRGTPESGSVDIASGIQFWNGYEAYIVLAAGHDTERTLYHELCHLIDTVVLTESTAYDQWEKLNPSGFQYANSPIHSMDADSWRQAGWESFLDDYSMSYPKEDRARIMEYAMTAGNAERFQSPYLQAKLKLLCTGIREAFDLEASANAFLWEQYLQTPLAPIT